MFSCSRRATGIKDTLRVALLVSSSLANRADRFPLRKYHNKNMLAAPKRQPVDEFDAQICKIMHRKRESLGQPKNRPKESSSQHRTQTKGRTPFAEMRPGKKTFTAWRRVYAALSAGSSGWSPFTVTFRWLVTSRCSLIGTWNSPSDFKGSSSAIFLRSMV